MREWPLKNKASYSCEQECVEQQNNSLLLFTFYVLPQITPCYKRRMSSKRIGSFVLCFALLVKQCQMMLHISFRLDIMMINCPCLQNIRYGLIKLCIPCHIQRKDILGVIHKKCSKWNIHANEAYIHVGRLNFGNVLYYLWNVYDILLTYSIVWTTTYNQHMNNLKNNYAIKLK